MARPYGEKIRNVAAHLSHANPEYRHPFLVRRDTVKRVGLIIITTDKGLCGGLNTNLLRMVLGQYKTWQGEGEEASATRASVSCSGWAPTSSRMQSRSATARRWTSWSAPSR